MSAFQQLFWNAFNKDHILTPEQMELVNSTKEFDFHPVRLDETNWQLVNAIQSKYIDFCGTGWTLYDSTQAHPDPDNSGHSHRVLAQGIGTEELKKALSTL